MPAVGMCSCRVAVFVVPGSGQAVFREPPWPGRTACRSLGAATVPAF